MVLDPTGCFSRRCAARFHHHVIRTYEQVDHRQRALDSCDARHFVHALLLFEFVDSDEIDSRDPIDAEREDLLLSMDVPRVS
jgi:hypothetical protein